MVNYQKNKYKFNTLEAICCVQADGREVNSGFIFAQLMASMMLGSSIAALFLCGPFYVLPEIYLPYVLGVAGASLILPAYDYQVWGCKTEALCSDGETDKSPLRTRCQEASLWNVFKPVPTPDPCKIVMGKLWWRCKPVSWELIIDSLLCKFLPVCLYPRTVCSRSYRMLSSCLKPGHDVGFSMVKRLYNNEHSNISWSDSIASKFLQLVVVWT